RTLGYNGWRDKYRYGQRWMAESYFSGVKRMFGETVRAHSQEAMFQEVMTKFILYDTLMTR
ncbi:MAG: IS5/IS1182 family transposase, partial [Candidatus Thermoplasmatota archaeon]|nr:IS5/IS1182 family transposase [Candidatus Thermoplasmatota archaeon]